MNTKFSLHPFPCYCVPGLSHCPLISLAKPIIATSMQNSITKWYSKNTRYFCYLRTDKTIILKINYQFFVLFNFWVNAIHITNINLIRNCQRSETYGDRQRQWNFVLENRYSRNGFCIKGYVSFSSWRGWRNFVRKSPKTWLLLGMRYRKFGPQWAKS